MPEEEKILSKKELEELQRKFVEKAAKEFIEGLPPEEEKVQKEQEKTLAETLGIEPQGKRKTEEPPYGRKI